MPLRNRSPKHEDLRLLEDASFVSELRPISFPVSGSGIIEVAPGWLFCNGATLNRITYKRLFDEIGTAYNIGGEAGTDFRIPDFKGRSPLPHADGQVGATRVANAGAIGNANAPGGVGGADVVAVAKAQLPTHVHDRGTLNISGGSGTHGPGTLGVHQASGDGANPGVEARVSRDGGVAPATTVNLPVGGNLDATVHSHPNANFSGSTEDGTATGLGAGSPTHENRPPNLPVPGMVIRV